MAAFRNFNHHFACLLKEFEQKVNFVSKREDNLVAHNIIKDIGKVHLNIDTSVEFILKIRNLEVGIYVRISITTICYNLFHLVFLIRHLVKDLQLHLNFVKMVQF